MRSEQTVKVTQVIVWIALGFTVFCHLWAANRGLEMTDEASYLLVALDPWGTWGHGTFHGFLLRPLYLLGGESVVGLRYLGFLILLVAAWRLGGALRMHLGPPSGPAHSLCVPVVMAASFTCYSAGMRTPCYNWMILVGAILMWSGWIRSGVCRFGSLELGLGLTIAVMGRWGAAALLFTLLVLLSLGLRDPQMGPRRRDWNNAVLAFFATLVPMVLYAGPQGIEDTVHAGILIAQTTGSHGFFLIHKYGWELFYYLYRIGRAFVWLLPAMLMFLWLGRKTPKKWPVEKIATFLFAGGLFLAALRGWWRGGFEQFGKESVLAGCWLLGVAWTVWAVGREAEARGQRAEDRGRKADDGVQGSVVWGLVATPFLCGIGTNTSIADYAGQGTVFFVAAGVLLFGGLPASSVSSVAGVAMAGLCLLQSSRVSSSLLGMYRVGSVFQQTEAIRWGPEKGRLWVAPEIHQVMKSLEGPFARHGFQRANFLIAVDNLCGVVYLAGGRSPGMPWFFPNQTVFLQKVSAILSKETLSSSWVLVRQSSTSRRLREWWPRDSVAPPRAVGSFRSKWDGQDEEFRLYRPSS